jgi:hypothetical protein
LYGGQRESPRAAEAVGWIALVGCFVGVCVGGRRREMGEEKREKKRRKRRMDECVESGKKDSAVGNRLRVSPSVFDCSEGF